MSVVHIAFVLATYMFVHLQMKYRERYWSFCGNGSNQENLVIYRAYQGNNESQDGSVRWSFNMALISISVPGKVFTSCQCWGLRTFKKRRPGIYGESCDFPEWPLASSSNSSVKRYTRIRKGRLRQRIRLLLQRRQMAILQPWRGRHILEHRPSW